MHKWTQDSNIQNYNNSLNYLLSVKGANLFKKAGDLIEGVEIYGNCVSYPTIEGVTGIAFVDKYTLRLTINHMYSTPFEIAKIKRNVEDLLDIFPKTKCEVEVTSDGVVIS